MTNFNLVRGEGREREQFLDNLQTHCSKLAVTVKTKKREILQCDLTQAFVHLYLGRKQVKGNKCFRSQVG